MTPASWAACLLACDRGCNEGFVIRLNDEAGTDIGTVGNPKPDGAISGAYNSEGSAQPSGFDRLDACGEWKLTITDDTAVDSGTLFNWSLFFSY